MDVCELRLQHKKTTLFIEQNKPLWTQEESIAFECAKEVMNDMIGICSSLIATERQKLNPDSKRIETLAATRLDLLKERDTIRWYDKDIIVRTREKYGFKIRIYREGGKCPV